MGQHIIPTRKSGNSHIVIGDIDLKEKTYIRKRKRERKRERYFVCLEYFFRNKEYIIYFIKYIYIYMEKMEDERNFI